MLEFIYCGQIVLTQDLATSLLEASKKYALLPELAARCEEFLVKNLTLDTIVDTVELAERLEAMTLRDGAIVYLIKNSAKAAENLDLDRLSKKFLDDLLLQSLFKY